MPQEVEVPSTRHAAVERQFYSVAEVALILGVAPSSVYRMVTSGEIPSRRIGERRIRIPCRPIDEMCAEAARLPTEDGATPAPEFLPEVPGSRAAGEDVA
jgi:excisionase family DNA binding protein